MSAAAERRAALVDQLRCLLAEAEALEPLLTGLPADVPAMHLPGERSVLGTLAHLAALDRRALSWLRCLLAEDAPVLDDAAPADEAVPTEVGPALRDLRESRSALAGAFAALAPSDWSRAATFPDGVQRDVAAFALAIAQRDAAELRRLAYRLHESNLRDAP